MEKSQLSKGVNDGVKFGNYFLKSVLLFHRVALKLLLTLALITAYSEDFGCLLKNFRPFRKLL